MKSGTVAKEPPGGCSNFEAMVGPYLDGELPVGEARGVEAHLAECDNCRTLAEQFRHLSRVARVAFGPTAKVSGEEWGAMWDHIQAQVRRQKAPPLQAQWHWTVSALALAALLLMALWIGMSLFQGRPGGLDPKEPDQVQNPDTEELEDTGVIDFSSG